MTDPDPNQENSIIITGEAKTRMAGILALRSALKLEVTTGLKRSRGRSARAMAQDFLKLSGRPSGRIVYYKLNEYIVSQLGPEFDKPI